MSGVSVSARQPTGLELADAGGVRLARKEDSMIASGKCYHDRVRRIRHSSAVCGDSAESEARLGEIHPPLWMVYTERSEWSRLFGGIHALFVGLGHRGLPWDAGDAGRVRTSRIR